MSDQLSYAPMAKSPRAREAYRRPETSLARCGAFGAKLETLGKLELLSQLFGKILESGCNEREAAA